MAGRGDYGMRGPGRLISGAPAEPIFVKPDQDVSAGKLTSPNNVFSKWKGPGADTDADTGDNIEADFAQQDFTTADYCVAQRIGGKWYVSCYLPGGAP